MGRGGQSTAGAVVTPPRDEFAQQRREAKEILGQRPLATRRIGLFVLAGSHAYGLARPDSDNDYRGFYVAPTAEVLSLQPPVPQLERNEPDLCVYEVSKFCHLASKANPNVLEILWAPVLSQDSAGELLRANRDAFLSERVRTTYGGYAMSQLKQLEKLADRNPDRVEKFARHLFRLFEQGSSLLSTGDMSIRVADPDELRRISTAPVEEIKQRFHELDAEFRQLESVLPPEPDYRRINEMLLEIRRESL